MRTEYIVKRIKIRIRCCVGIRLKHLISHSCVFLRLLHLTTHIVLIVYVLGSQVPCKVRVIARFPDIVTVMVAVTVTVLSRVAMGRRYEQGRSYGSSYG